MKIYLGTDHAGFYLKEKIKKFLLEKDYDVEDCGAHDFHPSDDYVDFISLVAQKVSEHPEDRGIILGGSGQAEAIVANKYPGVRAGVFYGPVVAKESVDASGKTSENPFAIVTLTREHNDANILSLGARFLTEKDALEAVEIWLTTPFSNEERHKRRIERMTLLEEKMSSQDPLRQGKQE